MKPKRKYERKRIARDNGLPATVPKQKSLPHLNQIRFETDATDGIIVSRDDFIDALHNCRGIITKVAEQFNVSRNHIYNIIRDDEEFIAAFYESREIRTDLIENKLIEGAINGSETLIKFYLERQAQDRGYMLRQQIDHNIEINVNAPESFLPPISEDATIVSDVAEESDD